MPCVRHFGLRRTLGLLTLRKTLLEDFHEIDDFGRPPFLAFGLDDIFVLRLLTFDKLQKLLRLLVAQLFAGNIFRGFLFDARLPLLRSIITW